MFTKEWCRIQQNFLQHIHLPYDKHQAWMGITQNGLLLVKIPIKLWDLCIHNCYNAPTKQVPGYCKLILLFIVEALYNLESHVLSLDKSTQQQFTDFFSKLIHNSGKQAAGMGPNFHSINNYFA